MVLIDGFTGAGKSTLARQLGKATSSQVIHLDDFAEGQLGETSSTYLGLLDLPRLSCRISSVSNTVIDGVTVLDVAAKILARPTIHIYVKRLSSNGTWADQDEFVPDEELEAFAPPSLLRKHVRAYHLQARPHEFCDAVFLRTEDKC